MSSIAGLGSSKPPKAQRKGKEPPPAPPPALAAPAPARPRAEALQGSAIAAGAKAEYGELDLSLPPPAFPPPPYLRDERAIEAWNAPEFQERLAQDEKAFPAAKAQQQGGKQLEKYAERCVAGALDAAFESLRAAGGEEFAAGLVGAMVQQIQNPTKVKQGGLNNCGFQCMQAAYIDAAPAEFVNKVGQLFATGQTKLGNTLLTVPEGLKGEGGPFNYGSLKSLDFVFQGAMEEAASRIKGVDATAESIAMEGLSVEDQEALVKALFTRGDGEDSRLLFDPATELGRYERGGKAWARRHPEEAEERRQEAVTRSLDHIEKELGKSKAQTLQVLTEGGGVHFLTLLGPDGKGGYRSNDSEFPSVDRAWLERHMCTDTEATGGEGSGVFKAAGPRRDR